MKKEFKTAISGKQAAAFLQNLVVRVRKQGNPGP